MMRLTLGFADEVAHIAVERAIAEFRTSRPVLIEDGAEAALTVAVEGLCPDLCAALDPVAGGRARLVLPAARLRRLGLDRARPGALALPILDAGRIEALALKVDARIDAPFAARLPSTRMRWSWRGSRSCCRRPWSCRFRAASPSIRRSCASRAPRSAATARPRSSDLKIVGRAPVPLEGAPGDRIRGLPRRRGLARSGRDHRRQARSVAARGRAAAFRLPDRRPVRQPQMRLRRPTAPDSALDGRERAAASCSISIRKAAGTASPTRSAPTSCRRKATTPTTPTRCWASIWTSAASTSRPRC